MAEEFNLKIRAYAKIDDIRRISPNVRDAGYTLADLDCIENLGNARMYAKTLLDNHVNSSLQLVQVFKTDLRTVKAILNIPQNLEQLAAGYQVHRASFMIGHDPLKTVAFSGELNFDITYNVHVCSNGKLLVLETMAERDKRIEATALKIAKSLGAGLYASIIRQKEYEDISKFL